MIIVEKAEPKDVADIAPLFDAYRQFYDQPADTAKAQAYLTARLSNQDCVVYIARDDSGSAIGFTQLYPTFCSVSAAHVWILYDLFVAPEARRKGAARKLLAAGRAHAESTGAAWIKLETNVDNIPGQTLYESDGWSRDTEFYSYYHFLGRADDAGGNA